MARLLRDEAFDTATVARALRASLDGIQRRGAASAGDKTMVDALAPAIAALEARLDAEPSYSTGRFPGSPARPSPTRRRSPPNWSR